ncbi:uncharacterized protein KY384_007572 [Bacidia gigantensis]|uniref:uncharacterized protein n=1 Tax=Bacidia gigantensis TaxID=2732470 RepID=UPI001D04A128|nr:uncharacterized protein KY384_007572 [Bacidia gigantensis]KAG8527420.1 hypothetical protein KY384_007572 [Bacidia gigantensis]
MSSVDHGHENETAVLPAEQITQDGSAGSDTDTGVNPKANSANKDGPDAPHHTRSNSVKKPAAFKAVSVTKNFLAKAGTPTAPNPKVNGETNATTTNGTGSLLLASRPRLVAKSSGAKQAKTAFGSRNGAGPDPMQVWNRNRSTPTQHAPKHLTDEELKQQYGIHLATRIQADGDGKEAKWADIDDDEDDWAPESIEWNDGTKITLSQNDSAALLAEHQAAEEAAKRREEELEKAKAAKTAAEKKPATSVGPNATVLKPRSTLQSKPGAPLVLKTPSEKPTLVSKPTTNAPAKSPWATLPPVDKVPPIDINPQIQDSAPRSLPNGIQQSISPQPQKEQPTLTLEAGSFRRGGSDSQRDNVGQLFNSQTGRYEPANAPRRGSVRKDNIRAPSVLQRVGNSQDICVSGDARRPSQDDQTTSGRRKSSTVSGDSAFQGRRPSFARGADAAPERYDSPHSQAVASPSLSAFPQSATQSPAMHYSQPSTGSAYQARPGSGSAGTSVEQDEVALQKQLMKEKREQAIKRKKDLQEAEEAEKKERIKKLMESLPPQEKTTEVKKEAPAMTIEKRPADGESLENERTEENKPKLQDAKVSKNPAEGSSVSMKSPPKPPAPSASGEPQQYGMMKVHAPARREPLQQVQDTLLAEKAKAQPPPQKTTPVDFDAQLEPEKVAEMQSYSQRPSPHGVDSAKQAERGASNQALGQRLPPGLEPKTGLEKDRTPPVVNGMPPPSKSDRFFPRSPEAQSQRQGGELRQQPWNDLPRDSKMYAQWNSQNLLREPNSPWGVSPQPRNLGNGPFDRTVQRPQSRQQEQFASPALAPIGPPKHLQPVKDGRDTLRTNNRSPGPVLEHSESVQSFPSQERADGSRPDSYGRLVDPEQRLPSPQFPPGNQMRAPIQNQNRGDRGSVLSAWNNFQVTSAQEEAEKRRILQQQLDARNAEELRTGVKYEPPAATFNETWRQVKTDDHGPGRQVIGVQKSHVIPGMSAAAHGPTEIRGPSFVNSMDLANAFPGGLGRGSRYFPTAGRLQAHYQEALPFSPFFRRSDSPPPPDTDDHPVAAAEPRRITVRLPITGIDDDNARPKVRLPPSTATPGQSPQPTPAQPSLLRTASQPLVNNPTWQDRFNGLLGVKRASLDKSPERSNAQLSDFSATREPLDLPTPRIQAAVALPPHGEPSSPVGLKVASQDHQGEEALFEPESGSTPSVLFPAVLGRVAWLEKPLRRNPLKPQPPSSEVEAITRDTLNFPRLFNQQNLLLVFINIKGMASTRSKPMHAQNGFVNAKEPQPHQRSSSQQSLSGKPKPQGRGFKPRESSGTHSHNAKAVNQNGGHKDTGAGQSRNNFRNNARPHPRGPNYPSQPPQPAAWEYVIAT